ncbi:MAG: hypothetical protein ACOX9C_00325 [Kiritimatiellia bacterium]|jgi:hypothetical protein
MFLFSGSFRRRCRIVIGCVLIVVGLFGALHAVRAALAQRLYVKTKYGFAGGLTAPVAKSESVAEVARNAHAANRLYPHNYYFSSYAARCALEEAVEARSSTEFRDALATARFFARHAVALNPYDGESRMLHARVMAEEGRVREAIDYWRTEVLAREYWCEANHEFFARLCLRSRDPADRAAAADELPFVRDPELRAKLIRIRKQLGK